MEQRMLGQEAEPASKRRITWPRWTGFGERTVWDVLQLLIVPIALAVIGFVFTMQQDARQQAIEDARAERDRKLGEEQAQDAALQAYLEYMSRLLLEDRLRESEADSEVRTLARARTLTVLQQLQADPREEDTDKEQVMEFLIEAGLIDRVDGADPVVRLEEASLSGTDLDDEDLQGADLQDADLQGADLEGTNLAGADLAGAQLQGADLRHANLKEANLEDAQFRGANLTHANLEEANLADAQLEDANGTSKAELQRQAASLEEAILPDGQTYETWLRQKYQEWLSQKYRE